MSQYEGEYKIYEKKVLVLQLDILQMMTGKPTLPTIINLQKMSRDGGEML